MSCIYGPHQFGTEDQGWVAHFLIRALKGEPITLYGDGMQVRDILFVDDLVDAFLLAQARDARAVGPGVQHRRRPGQHDQPARPAGHDRALNGRRPQIRIGAWRPGDQRYYVSDIQQDAAGDRLVAEGGRARKACAGSTTGCATTRSSRARRGRPPAGRAATPGVEDAQGADARRSPSPSGRAGRRRYDPAAVECRPSRLDRTLRPTMRAAVRRRPRKIEMREVPVPEPGAGPGAGAAGRLRRLRVQRPAVGGARVVQVPVGPGQLGHEGWGVVDAVGERRDARSRRATAWRCSPTTPTPNTTSPTQSQRGRACRRRWTAQPFPAEPLGCAMNIFRRSGIKAGQTVAIVGIGFLGALLTRLAAQAGARVIAISRRPFSLDVARADGGGRSRSRWTTTGRSSSRCKRLTGGRRFCDVVIEAVGKQWPLDLAAELTRERGRLVIAGYHQDGPRQVNMQLWNWRGLDVINAHEREPRGLPRRHAAAPSRPSPPAASTRRRSTRTVPAGAARRRAGHDARPARRVPEGAGR